MLLTRESLPQTISDIAALDDLLCRPSQALIDDLRKVDGDIMVLGVAGKMGPTLAGLAKAAVPERRIIGVARFSDAQVKDWLHARSVETINCDLLDDAAIKALPKIPNIVFMAGRKFGAEGDLSPTWAMNAHVPALEAQAFAGSGRAGVSRPGVGGAVLCRPADRAVLDRLRLSVRARQRQGRRRKRGAQSARRICAILR